ncbi:hypothetical protein DPEC_G00261590 [Dallia pectoralis]|uniref:Uncharacterized protein n=1 Tax=Dallia pectoralis TaxID=75939 RepID=A0ACC2FRW4_DALPE|nr:hypothetical protein DPEC_G00261590 [Dallia pectoralis]
MERKAWTKTGSAPGKRTVSILHGTKTHQENAVAPSVAYRLTTDKKGRAKPYCPYCNNSEHYLNQCSAIQSLNKEKVTEWIKTNKKCWRCGRDHQASQCTLKKPCGICQGPHLQVLHEVNIRPPKEAAKEESCLVNTATEVLYLERPVDCNRVLLKVARVTLYHGNRTLDTYAILDDGSERTMLLPRLHRSSEYRATQKNWLSELFDRTSRPLKAHQSPSVSLSLPAQDHFPDKWGIHSISNRASRPHLPGG